MKSKINGEWIIIKDKKKNYLPHYQSHNCVEISRVEDALLYTTENYSDNTTAGKSDSLSDYSFLYFCKRDKEENPSIQEL